MLTSLLQLPCRRGVELHLLLLILENATFACPENEAHLITPTMPASTAENGSATSHGADGGQLSNAGRRSTPQLRQPFSAWLVDRLPGLYRAVRGGRVPRECLHSALAVLMNVAHNSAAGREVVGSAGAVDVAAKLLALIAEPFLQRLGALVGRNDNCKLVR